MLAGLEQELPRADYKLDIEFIDSKRFPGAANTALFRQRLELKLAQLEPYDLILTSDDNALRFALSNRDLLARAPTVFFGVNSQALAIAQNRDPAVTGVVEASSVTDTLKLAARLFPIRRNVWVVIDDTPTSLGDLARMRYSSSAPGQLTLHYLNMADLSWDELQQALLELDYDDMVYFFSAYHDKLGVEKRFAEGVQWVSEAAETPMLHLWQHDIPGLALTGGVLVDHKEQAAEAARIAKRVLQGESISTIPVVERSPNITSLDWPSLQKFGAKMSAIPAQAQLLNRPQNFWYLYRYEIALAVTVLLAFLIVSSSLLYSSIRLRRVQQATNRSEKLLSAAFNHSPVGMMMSSAQDGTIRSCNQGVLQLSGYRAEELEGESIEKLSLWFSDGNQSQRFSFKRNMDSGQSTDVTLVTKDRRVRHVMLSNVTLELDEPLNFTVLRDITDLKQQHAQLSQAAAVFASSAEGIVITDASHKVLQVNAAFSEISGYAAEEVVGKTAAFDAIWQQDKQMSLEMWHQLKRHGRWSGEAKGSRKDGQPYLLNLSISRICDDSDQVSGYVAVINDISELKATQQQLDFLAYHDPLTGLANRTRFNHELRAAIDYARAEGHSVALLFIDLDRFKNVNDSFGHMLGDKVLIEVASRLKHALPAKVTVARLGGDEFTLIMRDFAALSEVETIARSIIERLRQPIEVEGIEVSLSASIGISLSPQDAQDSARLLRNADTAMYHAKERGRNTFAFYQPDQTHLVQQKFSLEKELRSAIKEKQLVPYFQPQIDMATGQLIGAEALVRWIHPLQGVISPAAFLPVAEETGLIIGLSELVLVKACAQMRDWIDRGVPVPKVSVNVSGKQIEYSDLVAVVERALGIYQLDAACLNLEITEDFIMHDPDAAFATLNRLKALGVSLSIDDFGTGYSSLSQLKRMPVDFLKIDKSFVDDIPGDKDNEAISKVTLMLARELSLQVVVEGVETDAQHQFFVAEHCDAAQGYLYSRPLPAKELEQWLSEAATFPQ